MAAALAAAALAAAVAIVLVPMTATGAAAAPAGISGGAAAVRVQHAVLESTVPVAGAQISRLPAQVSLLFGEAVTVDDASLRVLSPAGKRVDAGMVVHPAGQQSAVATAIPPTLPHGSYTVVWRVISADSHPVAGTFSFGYGVAAGAAVAAPQGSATVEVLAGVARFAGFAGLAVAGGVVAFAALVWPGAWGRRRLRVLLVAGLAVLAVSAAASVLLTGPDDAAAGLSHLADGHLLHQTLSTRYGRLVALRCALAVAALLALAVARRRRTGSAVRISTTERFGGPAVVVAGVLTFSLSEHAGTGSQVPFATVVDATHLSAVVAWVGGLVVLLAVVLDRRDPAPAGTLRRWSRLALGAVVVIVASGTYASWREVGTLPALPDTTYGRLLLVKIGLLVALVGLGALGRRLTHRDDAETASVRVLRRSVATEVTLSVAVLSVAAVLVNAQPGRDSYDPSHTLTVAAVLPGTGALRTRVHVDTTRPGRTDYAIAVTDSTGRSQSYEQVSALLTDPSRGLGPVRFTLPPSATGTGVARAVVIPAPGRWQLDLQIRTDAVTSYAASDTYLVR